MTTYELIGEVLDDPMYNLTMTLPARFAAGPIVRLASAVSRLAKLVGWRRLAIAADCYGYDIADHDPADATWALHRSQCGWAYIDDSFRPSAAA